MFLIIALLFIPWSGFCQTTSNIDLKSDLHREPQSRLHVKQDRFYWEDILLTESENKSPISFYPNFSDNRFISDHMQRLMYPYLLPLDSPIKSILDEIFAHSRVIKNKRSLQRAGFTILFSQKRSFIIVAKHPKVIGHLFKIYLDSKNVRKDGMSGWELLTTRCIVAQKIKNIIQKKKIHHFTVADKWLYPLPVLKKNRKSHLESVILVVKDMQIYNRNISRCAWKEKVTRRYLRELYAVLGKGYGSAFLHGNIPYTKAGTFAFIDTEYNKREIPLNHARRFLSKKMQPYWDSIVRRSSEKKRDIDVSPNAQN